jgi:hypothetical protein
MGTFAETANVDYRLSFADQGKETHSFPFAENKQKFCCFRFPLVPFSVYIYTETAA